MWQIWLILSGLFLVLEIVTVGFLVFWFAIGAFIAMLVSFFTENAIIQTLVFLISSTALLFITKPFVNKVTFKDSSVKTNAFKIEGKGQIKINGEIWSAKSYNDTYISTDTDVIIEKLDGVKALVKPLASNNK